MSNARNLANLLSASGDVKTSALDNAPAPTKSSIDSLGIAATSVTGSQASAITANTAKVTNYNQTQSDINALGITATSVDLGNWTITESSGVMYFATLGTNKMKLDASGNFTCVGDVTASGTI